MSRLAVTAVTDDNRSMYVACLERRHSSLLPSYARVRSRLLISYWGHAWRTALRMLTADPAFCGPMLFFHARAVTILLFLRLALIQKWRPFPRSVFLRGNSPCPRRRPGGVGHAAGSAQRLAMPERQGR